MLIAMKTVDCLTSIHSSFPLPNQTTIYEELIIGMICNENFFTKESLCNTPISRLILKGKALIYMKSLTNKYICISFKLK